MKKETITILGVDDNPESLDALELVVRGLGHRFMKALSGDEALQRLERTLPLKQHFPQLFSAGLASHQLGRYPEALSYLQMASEEAPGSAEVYYEIGSLYRKVEQYEKAIESLEEAIHLRSDFVDAYNQLGITYHDQGKYVEALTVFRAT